MPRRTIAAPTNQPIDVHTTIQMPNSTPAEKKDTEKPDFWSYMHSLTPEQWKAHIVYLTRENPKTSINGIGGYLTKLQQPFDIEDIKLAYGGYEFSYIMKNNNDIAYSGRFRVESPPKYDPSRENGTTPTNGAGAAMDGNVLKVLEQQNERLYQVLTTLQGAKEENPAIAGAMEILTDAYKKGLNAVAGQPGTGADAAKQLDSVLALAERIVSVRGGGGGGITETITLLKELGLFTKPKTLAEQLAEVKALSELMSPSDTPKDWKAMGLKMLGEHLPEILDTFKGNAETNAAAAQARAVEAQGRARAAEALRNTQSRVVTQERIAAVAASPAQPVAVNGGLQVVSRDTAAPPINLDEAVGTVPTSQEQLDQAMKITMVNMMRSGASGAAIASYCEDLKPEFAKDFTKYTEEIITKFFQADDILKLMAEDPRWLEVLADAREYMQDEVTVN